MRRRIFTILCSLFALVILSFAAFKWYARQRAMEEALARLELLVAKGNEESRAADAMLAERIDAVSAALSAEVRDSRTDTASRIRGVERRVTGRVEGLSSQVNSVEERVGSVGEQFATVAGTVVSVDERIANVEGTVVSVDRKVHAVDERVAGIAGSVRAVDERVATVAGTVGTVGEQVAGVAGAVGTVEAKVDALGAVAPSQGDDRAWISPLDLPTERALRAGRKAFVAEDYGSAAASFSEANRLNPENKEARLFTLISRFYAEPSNSNQYPALRRYLAAALSDDPYDPEALRASARLSMEQGDWESALDFYTILDSTGRAASRDFREAATAARYVKNEDKERYFSERAK